jgi:hypothetical protein
MAASAPPGRPAAVALAAILSVEPRMAGSTAIVPAVVPVKNAFPVLPSRPKPAAWRVLTELASAAAIVSSWAM